MMNTDLLTFFHPGDSAGRDWAFYIQTGDSATTEVWVFDRGEAELSRFATSGVSSEEEFKNLINDLHVAIQPRGGVYVYAWDHNGMARIRLVRVEAPGYAPPQRVLRLSPVGDARFEGVANSTDLKVGDHLIVPVSADAEARLEGFCQQLKGFPADVEASILNLIRRPSLEWRLWRIEHTLSLPPATRAEQSRSQTRRETFWEKLRRSVMRQVPVGPAVLAALILTAGTLGAYAALSKNPEDPAASDPSSETEPSIRISKVAPGSDPQNSDPAGNGGGSADIDEALGALLTALGKTENPGLKSLYDSHFKSQSKDFSKSPTFWGLAKLQARQLGLINESDAMLGNLDVQSGVKTVYGKKESIEALKDQKDALELLAWTCCQRSQKPEFPKTRSDPNPLLLPVGRECKDLKPADVVSGLEALTEWVADQNQ